MIDHNLIYAPIEGSRGCSNTCSFCSLQKFWTNEKIKLRFKSVKRVVDEIEFIHKKYNINSFLFLDCSFENPHLNKDRIIETANEIISRNLNVITSYSIHYTKLYDIEKVKFIGLGRRNYAKLICEMGEHFNIEDLLHISQPIDKLTNDWEKGKKKG